MDLISRVAVMSALAWMLSGCLAKTVVDVATLPVKVAGKAVDLATTSQSEADQKRGRQIRKREEELGRLQREHDKLARKCQGGDSRACERDATVSAQISDLTPRVPLEAR